MIRKIFFILAFFFAVTSGYSQKNYFYANFKAPVLVFIQSSVGHSSPYVESDYRDGIVVGGGYGMRIRDFFFLETGFDYLFGSFLTQNTRYYIGSLQSSETVVSNKALSFVLNPVFKMALSEEISFRGTVGLHFQKLFSTANKYNYQQLNNEVVLRDNYSYTTKSMFNFNVQPGIGVMYERSEHFYMGFDISYIRINWDKNIQQLENFNQLDVVLPTYQTSNLFVSLKFMFR